jgi:hypothetical protein
MASYTAHIPQCTIGPPLRCCYRDVGRPGGFCGDLAVAKRPGSLYFAPLYFCGVHRLPADVPIAGERVFRRVRLSLDVLLAAIDPAAPVAQAEALERLELAVKALGGEMDVLRVTSSFVRWTPPAGQGRAFGAAGDPE